MVNCIPVAVVRLPYRGRSAADISHHRLLRLRHRKGDLLEGNHANGIPTAM